MDLNEMNENWQNEAPTLAAVEKTNPYTVPEGYFREMEEQLRRRINISRFDNNQALFTVPENYFETLENNIISVSKLEQFKEAGSNVFTVPDNYFINLEEKIKAKLEPRRIEEAKPKIKRLYSSWVTYAAAACITAIISFGIYFNNSNNNNRNIQAQLAELPAEDIVDYLQLYSDAGDVPVIIESLENATDLSQLSPEISEQEIEQYLNLNL